MARKNRSCRRRLRKAAATTIFALQLKKNRHNLDRQVHTRAHSQRTHSLTHTHTRTQLHSLRAQRVAWLSSPLCFRSYFTLKRPFRCTFNGLFLFSLRAAQRGRESASASARARERDTIYMCVFSNSPHCGSGPA